MQEETRVYKKRPWKGAYLLQKRPVCMKRDVYTRNETDIQEKRPRKEIYQCKKRPVYIKRDLGKELIFYRRDLCV